MCETIAYKNVCAVHKTLRTLASRTGLSHFYKRTSFCHTGNLVQNCALVDINYIKGLMLQHMTSFADIKSKMTDL